MALLDQMEEIRVGTTVEDGLISYKTVPSKAFKVYEKDVKLNQNIIS